KVFILLFSFCLYITVAKAQIPVDLSDFDHQSGVTASAEEEVLDVRWPAGEEKEGRLVVDLQQGRPLLKSIQLSDRGKLQEIAGNLDLEFILTVGKRSLERNGWTVFFDSPAYRPHESYLVALDKKNAKVISEGSRTRIIIGSANAGSF